MFIIIAMFNLLLMVRHINDGLESVIKDLHEISNNRKTICK